MQRNTWGGVTGSTTYYAAAGAMRVNGVLYYVLKDKLGSASVMLDSSGGIVGETRYYPFGETRETNGSMLTDRLFTGQREMADLGLYHYGARFYNPTLGRFIQPDTIVPSPGNPQSLNRFSYVYNNPIRYNDPSGNRPAGRCGDGGGCDKNPYVYVPSKKTPVTTTVPTPRTVTNEKKERVYSSPANTLGPQPIIELNKGTTSSKSNQCLICNDPTLISRDNFQSTPIYPVLKTPNYYDGPYAEKTGDKWFSLPLLIADFAHLYQYQTNLPAKLLDNYVTANISYENHLDWPNYYTLITSLDITNSTDTTLYFYSGVLNDMPMKTNKTVIIEPNNSVTIPSSILLRRSDFSMNLYLFSETYNLITVSARKP